MPTELADPAGTVVAGRYEIVEALGRGSFGHTFLARDRQGGGSVAVKVLDPRGAADWKAHELFEREAVVLRSLRHHGVPEVHDVVQDAWRGVPASFLVMEFVEGTSLERMIEEQRQLDPAEVLHLFLEMLGILEYLHGRVPPILHRDIKPSNIVVRPDGLPTLVDFGSVRRVFLAPGESGSTVAGTYGYMPYEQYMGQATPASDLYAMAATFLHLLTGRPPRDFMTDDGRIQVPDALSADARLGAVLARLLRPSPTERFAGAREVRQALLAAVAPRSAEGGGRSLARVAAEAVALAPAPRAITGSTAELLDRLAPNTWELMDTTSKPGDRAGIVDWLGLAFFTVLTAGSLPVVFFSMARARRRRLRRFVRDGVPGTAEVLGIGTEPTAFGEKIAMVSYQFEADGALHRDADRVLPVIAARWQPGDYVQILYLPAEDYDSVIISTG
jgi:serine/threonine protein kinase